MFTEDELHQARAVSVLEIAEEHGARLKRSGRERVGPCPVCGGVRPFRDLAQRERLALPRMRKGGDVIDARDASQRLLVRRSGEDADRRRRRNAERRQPTPEEIAAREAREANGAETKPKSRRARK